MAGDSPCHAYLCPLGEVWCNARRITIHDAVNELPVFAFRAILGLPFAIHGNGKCRERVAAVHLLCFGRLGEIADKNRLIHFSFFLSNLLIS